MPSLNGLLEGLSQTKSFRKVLGHLEKGEAGGKKPSLRLGNLYGSAKSFVASGLSDNRSGKILLVTRGARQAEKIEADLVNYLDEDSISLYPQWEVLPYEDTVEDREIVGRRIEILAGLMDRRPGITVAPVKSLMQKVLSPENFCDKVLTLRTDSMIDLDMLVSDLVDMGFSREVMVEEVGTFALRGGILDIYGYRMETPVRIEFEGDRIVEMRFFEISTQRSVQRAEEAVVLPVAEPFTWRYKEDGATDTLREVFEYLDSDTLLVFDEYESVIEEAEHFHDELEGFFERATERGGTIFRPPKELFLSADELRARFECYSRADLCSLHRSSDPEDDAVSIRFDTREPPSVNRNIDQLRTNLNLDFNNQRTSYILCDTSGQMERLDELLEDSAELARLCSGSLETGFVYREAGLVIYTDHEIFRRFRHVRSRDRYQRAPSLESFSSLAEGDFVVHIDYGIGSYRGLKKIQTENYSVECLWLEYAEGEFLYVPIDQLSLVERYSSEDGVVPVIHKIGGAQWAKMKARTVKAIEDMTEELVEIYAARSVLGGYKFSTDTDWQRELESSFVYEETQDQLRVIEDIKRDMENSSCMDRLLCGDVGFGKTEVALRAAFKAVQEGKQVAILVPTTVLAQQHYITFSERLADFPVKVDTLSRFKSPGEQKKIISKLESGELDIVIGTHRLLSKDVKLKDLGLLVVDEEQRFGVRQKEKLKSLKRQVDTLAMTATPIPRTLHMGLMGIRDLSLIATPPQDRLPIITQVCAFKEEVIQEAVSRELARDGQVFFVHNRVGSIYSMLSYLRRIAPGARIGVAHGQMPERELESSMRRFQNREIDVLLSTMIIENGLDFPNANTIIVNRADCFGLSQLYQLRGRVGRSYHRAYAYLLVPPLRLVTDDAVKRLRVLEEYTELGSGYEIALHDLEMRGTGNLLGSQQHGFINAVGFDTYLKLLQEAISKLNDERPAADIVPAKITLDLPAFLPEAYVPDQKQKLSLYRKISAIKEPRELDEVAEELADRFGPLPEEAAGLLDKARLKIYASALGMEALFVSDTYCKLDFGRTLKYRLAPISRALERVEGEKKVASISPPSILIKPASKRLAFEQIIGVLAEISGRPGEIIENFD
jgi:transcription-repair coupling factor (superfamily II helicase)